VEREREREWQVREEKGERRTTGLRTVAPPPSHHRLNPLSSMLYPSNFAKS